MEADRDVRQRGPHRDPLQGQQFESRTDDHTGRQQHGAPDPLHR